MPVDVRYSLRHRFRQDFLDRSACLDNGDTPMGVPFIRSLEAQVVFAVAVSENLLQGDFLFRVYLAPLLDFVLECSAVQAYSFTGQLQKLISQGSPAGRENPAPKIMSRNGGWSLGLVTGVISSLLVILATSNL